MEVVRDAGACPPHDSGSVVTIGAYDGVHLGHRVVIDHVRRRAGSSGLSSAVVTFDRHPASVVRPESAPRLLTDPDQTLELLAATGIDRCPGRSEERRVGKGCVGTYRSRWYTYPYTKNKNN